MVKFIFVTLGFLSQILAVAVIKRNESIATEVYFSKFNQERLPVFESKANSERKNIMKRESRLITYSTEKTRELLNSFNLRLKSFIKGRDFDFHSFKLSSSKLMDQLASISSFMQRANILDRKLSVTFAFSEHMFHVMVDSAELLDSFEPPIGSAQNLVYKVTQLNVRLFKLRDFEGVPKTNNKSYETVVARLIKRLRFWEMEFYNVKTVSPAMKIVFNHQYVKAKQSLETLREYGKQHTKPPLKEL